MHDLALGGRKHPGGGGGGSGAGGSSGGGSVEDLKAQRQRQEQEERQLLLDMPETHPFAKMPPLASNRSSSGNSRSGSRKERILAREAENATPWLATSTDSGLNFLFYKSSSGSGSSGGGGPPGDERGGRGGTENAGGGRSSGSSGGGASWERAPYPPGALPPSGEAGGATRTHDDVTNNSKFDFGQHHQLRQQSFQPDREISDLPLAEDICPDPPHAATCGGVRDWRKEAEAAPITTTITTSWTAAASVSTNSSGVFVTRDHASPSVATSACPPNPHSDHSHISPGGPIAPAPIPRPRVQPPATRPPAPVHERKPSYNLLASMIPDISKLGKPPTAAPLHAPGAVRGAAPGGEGFPGATGFAAAGAAHFSPADSYLRVGVEDGGVRTRQVSVHIKT